MKKLFILMMALMMSFTVNAQTAVETSRFFDNWSIGATGGVNTNLHDWNTGGGVLGLQLTKGITPVFSLEFSAQIGTDDIVWDGDSWSWAFPNAPFNKRHISTANAMVNGKVNLMNWIGGYPGKPRVFEIQARAGAGYQRCIAAESNHFVGDAGLDFDFNIGQKRAWTVTVRPAVLWNTRSDENNWQKGRYATAQVTAGVVYHFKNKNGLHYFKTYDIEAMEYEKARLQKLLAEKPKQVYVDRVVTKEVIKEVTKTEVVSTGSSVFFNINSDKVASKKDLVNLKDLAEYAKQNNKTLVVTGYADSKTGSAEYNQALSERRAQTVKQELMNMGVDESLIEAKGVGGVAELNPDSYNRRVVVSIK